MANINQNWIKTFESIVWKILSYSELKCGWKWNPIQVFIFAKVEDAAFKWQALKTKECEKGAATFRNKVSGSVQIVWDGIVSVHAFHKDEHYYIGEEILWTLIEAKGTMAQSQPDLPPPYICISLKLEVAGTKKKQESKK